MIEKNNTERLRLKRVFTLILFYDGPHCAMLQVAASSSIKQYSMDLFYSCPNSRHLQNYTTSSQPKFRELIQRVEMTLAL